MLDWSGLTCVAASETLGLRRDDHPERPGFSEAGAQPARVVARVDAAFDFPHRFIVCDLDILPDRCNRPANILIERPVLARDRINELATESEAACLETIERVHQ